ncbi:SSI family serine proteinase inhibitor [Streptomyces sp. NBC_01255]|uniref:SSI family serine proteinase inhibitor n=1 Tax=Streptomyces sp. NBC_01255 TaxID=2903798 RepID=UPI002E308C50|nr:SSI family serine proteinase inhibitor [Streptomyces sp. NBC_01255]
MNKILTGLLGAGILAAGLAPAASAVGLVEPTLDAHLLLTATRMQGETEVIGFVRLDCPGSEGHDHPLTREACRDLRTADGDLDRLPGQSTAVCSNDSTAVTVTAHGTFRGREIRWERTYEDDCALMLATGPVFDF